MLDRFCDHSFWDSNISWSTPNPVFSKCFCETALLWPASGFLWALAPISIYLTSRNDELNLAWSRKFYLKLSFNFLLCLSAIFQITQPLFSTIRPIPIYQTVGAIIKFLSFVASLGNCLSIPTKCFSGSGNASKILLALVLMLHYKRKRIITSGLLFIYWLLMLIQSSVNFHTIINIQSTNRLSFGSQVSNKTDLVFGSIQLSCVISLFFLNCFADSQNLKTSNLTAKNESPFISCSFVSRLIFRWYDSMAYLGFRKYLTFSDIWDLPHEIKTKTIQQKFDKMLQSSFSFKSFASIKRSMGSDNLRPINGKPVKIGLLKNLAKCFRYWLTICGLLKLTASLLEFAHPQLMDALLTFVASDEPIWHGGMLTLTMFIASLCRSIFDSQYDFWIQTTSMTMKSALTATIYQKSLRLSQLGRRDYTTGEIVNLMAVDTQRIVDYVNTVNVIWSAPIQVTIAIILLWQQLGPASLTGLALMIALIPLNGVVRTKIKRLQTNVMKEKDKRAKLMSEMLNGMKVLKLYAWEGAFSDKITSIRQQEIGYLKRQANWTAFIYFFNNAMPFMVSLACFATYIIISPENVLDANKAFVSISLINIIRTPLAQLPQVIAYGANCMISLRRIEKYLEGDELDPNIISHEVNSKIPVIIRNGSFSWSHGERLTLDKVNLQVEANKLIAIVGPVGSGKSSLLSSLLGELYKKEGHVNVYGTMAYVPQTAWILNETLERNILFSSNYQENLYRNVIEACALTSDIAMLPGGDKTEIGEKGINLSGGQKQRVSIARAVYSNADIFLLDDPLSAVDAHVAKHLFDKVFGPRGMLRNKTRLLVTHRITFLPQVDEIIVLKDGKIYESGSYHSLMEKGGEFHNFIIQHLVDTRDSDLDGNDHEIIAEMAENVKSVIEKRQSHDSSYSIESIEALRRRIAKNSKSIDSSSDQICLNYKSPPNEASNKDNSKLIDSEQVEKGSIKWKVYVDYAKACGLVNIVTSLLLFTLLNSFTFASNLWLQAWSDDSLDPFNVNNISLRNMRLGVYAALGSIGNGLNLVNAVVLANAYITGAAWISNQMLNRIVTAPMSFFDTTPMGRVLNRFTKDIDVTDITIGLNFRGYLSLLFRAAAAIIGICFESSYMALGIFAVGIFYLLIQRFYISSSRQLRRMESVSRSPIYSHFSETITGATSIRAYGVCDWFIKDCYKKVDLNHGCFFPNIAANEWLVVRLELLGNLIVTLAAIFAIFSRGTRSPGTTGFALSYALQITDILNQLLRSVSNVENNIVSVERILEYTKIETESDWINDNHRPKKNWPDEGQIQFKDYSTRYRPGLDLVLKEISCSVSPNEKVGIVGRTGAGKSSLTLALFRLIEPVNGSIFIDGEDITDFGLHDLRSRLTVIPQDPVLFSASFRANLDPFNRHSDNEIWQALELSYLKEFVSSLEHGLEHEISEGGENLSVGQRQLICLTRALLRKSKILVLDEATAAVDVETDDLIQHTIRQEFSDCTIVTIAHRLNTIMDYDKIIVMDGGRIIEYDSPANLLAHKTSAFYFMVKEANLI